MMKLNAFNVRNCQLAKREASNRAFLESMSNPRFYIVPRTGTTIAETASRRLA